MKSATRTPLRRYGLSFARLVVGVLYANQVSASCTGPYFWADDVQVCIDRQSPQWAAMALREMPDARTLEILRTQIDSLDGKARFADRSLSHYGLLLLAKSNELSHSISQLVFEMNAHLAVSGAQPSFQEVNVFQRGRIHYVLVNNFTIRFRPTTDVSQAAMLLESYGARIEERSLIPGVFVVSFPRLTALEGLSRVNSLQGDGLVRYAKPNFEVFMPRPVVTRRKSRILRASNGSSSPPAIDPLFSEQWYLDNDGSPGHAHADVNAVLAWSVVKGSTAITVAILDEGVETQHEDLVGRIVDPYDAVGKDNVQDPQKYAYHGTAVAGIAAAATGNGFGIKGMAVKAKIMPVRIAEVDSADGWNISAPIVADGIRTAVIRGASVVSGSWSFFEHDSEITDAIDFALQNDRVVVFSTGNMGSDGEDYPAVLAKTRPVIAVGASNEWDEVKTFKSKDGDPSWGSNYGDAVTVVAPGVQMVTTGLTGNQDWYPGNYILDFCGTSGATPLVAGIAAMVLGENPAMTPTAVKGQLCRTAKDIGKKGHDRRSGCGRIDACSAVGGTVEQCRR